MSKVLAMMDKFRLLIGVGEWQIQRNSVALNYTHANDTYKISNSSLYNEDHWNHQQMTLCSLKTFPAECYSYTECYI